MGLVFGDIEIDGDQPDAASASPMPGNHRVGERVAHGEQHPRGRRVLEARDRRLRRQAAAVDRIAPQQQFVDRIVGESVAIIAVGMAARDREDALGDQIPDAVRHARRIARIGDRRREGRQQAEVPVGRFEQDRAAVRTRVRLIKGRDQRADRPGPQTEQSVLSSARSTQSPPCGETPSSQQRSTHPEAFVFQGNSLTRRMHDPYDLERDCGRHIDRQFRGVRPVIAASGRNGTLVPLTASDMDSPVLAFGPLVSSAAGRWRCRLRIGAQ